MKIAIHNVTNNDTIHASVRMNETEYMRLKEYMHATGQIEFPDHVVLVYRGRGWYRLHPTKVHNAIQKFSFAVSVLRRFEKMLEREVEEEIKKLVPLLLDEHLRITAFTPDKGYTFSRQLSDSLHPQQPTLTERGITGLQKLASKYGTNLKLA
jgi:hypothetical protein